MQLSIPETGFGFDIGSRRSDDLDRRLLELVAAAEEPTVLDIGCGAAQAALRLAAAGAIVTALDQYDFSEHIPESARSVCRFVLGDVRQCADITPGEFDFVVAQRVLHYLPYSDAQAVLGYLQNVTRYSAAFSFSGATSAIADYHPAIGRPLDKRFHTLRTKGAKLFGISEPICLYSATEVRDLLGSTGWQIEELWQSAFGNIKVIARP